MRERALRAIWAGANLNNIHSTKAMPIKWVDGRFKIFPTVHNAKVKIMQGVYPLKDAKGEPNSDLGVTSRGSLSETKVAQDELGVKTSKVATLGEAGKQLVEGPGELADPKTTLGEAGNPLIEGPGELADPEDDEYNVMPEQDVEGEYEIETILEHNKIRDKEYEYHVKFKDYEEDENMWLHQDALGEAQQVIAEYWERYSNTVMGTLGMEYDWEKAYRPSGMREEERYKSYEEMACIMDIHPDYRDKAAMAYTASMLSDKACMEINEPDLEVMMMGADGELQSTMFYDDHFSFWMANDFESHDEIVMAGVTEIKVNQLHDERKKTKVKTAHDKEIADMTKRRFVRLEDDKPKPANFVPAHLLSEAAKATAKKCRMSYTQKRETPEQLQSGEEGAHKARLVCMDLKVKYEKPKEETYSAVPTAEAFRLVVASTDIEKGDTLSTNDVQTAFLQSFKWQDSRLVLIVYWDEFTKDWVYEWIDGVIYGMQEGSYDWKNTLAFRLTHEMGFKEVKNMESIYHHPEKKITIPCHVDDPLIKARGAEARDWFHEEFNKLFECKGQQNLVEGKSLDYLSMNITITKEGDIQVDNKTKIEGYLEEMGLQDCNPAKEPMRKDLLNIIAENKKAGIKASPEVHAMNMKWNGELQWLCQSTHPVLATACGILSTLVAENWVGVDDAIKHTFRYLQGAKELCLVKKMGVRTGLTASSDADWAGLYKVLGEKRSRTGTVIKYDEMPVGWKSSWQQCKGTEYDLEADIATSSAEAETYAAADSAKMAIHLKNICEEIDIAVSKPVVIDIDAGAALGFINNTGSVGRMKHIDLRESWVNQMRDRKQVTFRKVPGTSNPADFFTKIITGPEFKRHQDELMSKIET